MTPMEAEARRKYDRSHITDEERRAIDAAVQAGRIQRIPRGVSGHTAENVVWCPKLNGLRSVDPEAAKRAYAMKGANSAKRGKAPASKAAALDANAKRAAERQATIARAAAMYSDQGMTVSEIAAELTVHPDTAKQYLRAAGVKFDHGKVIMRQRRDVKIWEMQRQGHTNAQIAAALGVDPKTVRNIIGKRSKA